MVFRRSENSAGNMGARNESVAEQKASSETEGGRKVRWSGYERRDGASNFAHPQWHHRPILQSRHSPST